MCAIELTFSADTPEQTCQFASHLAKTLVPGDVLLLSGDIGAGKTHFARCFIQSSLRVPEDVPSPTYTLVQTYDGQNGEIWHSDLYRLSDLSELEELGLLQAFSEAVCLVEWPDRLGDSAPESALSLTFEPGPDDDARIIYLEATDKRWLKRLQGLCDV